MYFINDIAGNLMGIKNDFMRINMTVLVAVARTA